MVTITKLVKSHAPPDLSVNCQVTGITVHPTHVLETAAARVVKKSTKKEEKIITGL